VSENATIEDIYNILLYAYEKKLKGVTIFRDKSKSFQILEKPKPDANQ
jgi:ribonucleotide reductase alpha subunit